MNKPLFDPREEWSFELIEKAWGVIDKIAKDKFKLDYYQPQIEIITAEQMLDGYSSVAMPIMYEHWSFGKSFIANDKAYKEGKMGLAYEVVINTNPSIAYLIEGNSMTMQTLVLAHAVCGHGAFFKNNYLFKEWTDADSILTYLKYAKEYVASCEKRYGELLVEQTLDSCHALQHFGVDKFKRPAKLKDEVAAQKAKAWDEYRRETFSDLDRTLPKKHRKAVAKTHAGNREFPEENLLYFIEKNSPTLQEWQRELVRIVRKIAQYFYPQMQTKVMNEGFASFIHYYMMEELNTQGLITDGSYLEFLESHTGVLNQPDMAQLNPYAIGFAIFDDIKRACENPDEEDYKWLPTVAGTDWVETVKDVVENYRDESFVLQFLSPKVIRKFRLFALFDAESMDSYLVTHIHSDDDVMKIREILAEKYSITNAIPQIEVSDVAWDDDRTLYLTHHVREENTLEYNTAKKTLKHIAALWGFPAEMTCINEFGTEVFIKKRN